MPQTQLFQLQQVDAEDGYFSGGLVYAHNLVPARAGWVAMAERQAIQVSNTPSGVAPKAVFETRLPFTAKLYMAGLKSGAGEVYELTSSATAIGPSLTTSNYPWTFLEFGDRLIVVNFDNAIKQRAAHAGALTNLVSSTLVPQAFVACVARSHLVLGNTYESATSYVQRVRWSARDDASDFDPSDATRSNYVDLTDNLGMIVGLEGGDNVTVFKTDGIQLLEYTGGTTYWQRYTLAKNIGCAGTKSIVPWRGDLYFFSGNGFWVVKANGEVKELENKQLRQLLRAPTAEYPVPMDGSIVFEAQWNAFGEVGPWGAVDPVSGVIFWLFTGRQYGAAGSGTYDHFAVCYHPDSGRWSTADGFTGTGESSGQVSGVGIASRAVVSPSSALTAQVGSKYAWPRSGLVWALANPSDGTGVFAGGQSVRPWKIRTGPLIGQPVSFEAARFWVAGGWVGHGGPHESGSPAARVIAAADPGVTLVGQQNSTLPAAQSIAANGFYAASSTATGVDGWMSFDPFIASFFQLELSVDSSIDPTRVEAVELRFTPVGQERLQK